jgi:2-amino-4-hydroxy-6-hydroxymethyldihydropteridine diphosphokinase
LENSPSNHLASQTAKCWISFGGNVGDVKATFDAALALLSLHNQIELGNRSGLYETVPMGTQAGNSFLNSVCGLTTSLAPQCLLNVLQSVENQLGRVRDLRWGPRTLDLDLLSYGQQVLDQPDLVVPHPGLIYRRFVLDPLIEIEPDWPHPTCHASVGQIVSLLKSRPLKVTVIDATAEMIESLGEKLESRFPHVQIVSDDLISTPSFRFQICGSILDCRGTVIDLRRSPGDVFEQVTSALTAMFDVPERVADW